VHIIDGLNPLGTSRPTSPQGRLATGVRCAHAYTQIGTINKRANARGAYNARIQYVNFVNILQFFQPFKLWKIKAR
jgi:hypothetical protein